MNKHGLPQVKPSSLKSIYYIRHRLLFCLFDNQQMGNQQCMCCEEVQAQTKNDLPQVKVVAHIESIKKPKLWQKVSQHLATFKPFRAQLPPNPKLTNFGKDIFEGNLNYKNKPQGYGTMYFHNGSVFVGQFQNGRANGPGHYIFTDGSYYHGNMQANQADGLNGEYVSEDLVYKGEFKANMFEGKGQQKGDNYQFKGTYHSSKKVEGTLTWIERTYDNEGDVTVVKNRTYIGSFDQNGQFHGEGKLINEYGQYKGQFVRGKKHGKGEFNYKVGIKYVGGYKQDIKEGEGTVYNKSGSIAFCGQMKNGLPNGKGYVINNFGDKVHLNWIDGLDERLLQTKKQIASTGVTS